MVAGRSTSLRAISPMLTGRRGGRAGRAVPADPVAGFPVGAEPSASVSGLLHLSLGAVEFGALAGAAFLLARFFAARGERGRATGSRAAGVVIVVAFAAGAVLSVGPAGVALLWLAVVTSFGWLLVASLWVCRVVPHPDVARRG